MEEIWKDIVGYEGLYQVSNFGRVKSLDRYRIGKRGSKTFCKGRIMSLNKMRNGYSLVQLMKNKKSCAFLVHRLVALAFIPIQHGKSYVDHIDGERGNNLVSNLRWCTAKENLNFDLARKNISASNRASEKCRKHIMNLQKSCIKPVVIVFPNGEIKEYESVKATEIDGFEHSHVSACCIGKLKHHRKCKCYYKLDYEIRIKGLSE